MGQRFFRVLPVLLLGFGLLSLPARAQVSPPKVLVLYDSTGQNGWMGRLYVQEMCNLLTHFNVTVVSQPVERYVAGQMTGCRAVFYLGMVYGNLLPAAFTRDVMNNTAVTVCWVDQNLWRIAWSKSGFNAAFEAKFAFRYLDVGDSFYSRFRYKNTVLTKDPSDLSFARLSILSPAKVSVKATAFDPNNPTNEVPYIVNSGKFWYVADNPFLAFDSNTDRGLIFADLLHDILVINHPTLHRALLRIEDVSALSDPARLRTIADTLWALKMPFAISLIPEYRDPLGTYNAGQPLIKRLTDAPEVEAAVSYMVTSGGQVLMHGYTHQLEDMLNPINAVSATDYEFVRVVKNADNSQTVLGPVPGDSTTWCDARLKAGIAILNQAGLRPAGWLTPHYIASPTDYRVIAAHFPYAVERGFYFAVDDAGKSHMTMQTFPYVTRDVYGLKHLPETIGYVNPDGTPPRTPASMIAAAAANLVVRDGWASGFFHWYMDPALLPEIVNGIRAKGYAFVTLADYTR